MIEDEIVRWHHQLSGHELEQNPGDSEEQGSLAWGYEELDITTEQKMKNNKTKTITNKYAKMIW